MILDKFSLKGKVAIVTGTGTGLGQAMAAGLAEAGADVSGVYNQHFPELAKKHVEKVGRRFLAVQADLRSIKPIRDIIQQTRSYFGQFDILVNNAGTIRRRPSVDFTEEDWDEVMNINLKSLFFLSQAAARYFFERGKGGKIINVASMLSFQGGILIPSYTASKSAVRGLTMTLANEWASSSINVNAIAPGYILTENTRPLKEDPVREPAITARIPAGRWGDPEDIQGAVVFLASSGSDYIHGFTIAIDGGWLGR
jgi:2-deoxy-D-gluconate 3-dehydrogenase